MLGDILAEGATFFGDRSGNLGRPTSPSQPEVSGCSMKRSCYLATIVVMFIVLLGLGCRQGKQAKDSYSSGGNTLSGGDVGTGINRLVVTKTANILPLKVCDKLFFRLIGWLITSTSYSYPFNPLSILLRCKFSHVNIAVAN